MSNPGSCPLPINCWRRKPDLFKEQASPAGCLTFQAGAAALPFAIGSQPALTLSSAK